MREHKHEEQPRLNLAQAENEEEGDESQIPPDVGENLMIIKALLIPENEQRKSTSYGDSWLRTDVGENLMIIIFCPIDSRKGAKKKWRLWRLLASDEYF